MHLNFDGKFADEQELAKLLLGESYFLDDPEITRNTESIIRFCRSNKNRRTKLDAFMEQYGLSNSEGIALMCLAESLMRIPDNQTRDALINEKLTSAKWSEHLGKAESFLVNSATWGLTFSKEFLQASTHASNNWLIALGKKIGESSIREAVQVAMQVLSKEFVCAESIGELNHSSWLKGNPCSFDMLGEASRNEEQSIQYFESYMESIHLISKINLAEGLNNGISIKLSALYSKYDAMHVRNVNQFLLPRLKDLIVDAVKKDVAVTIDAEEQDRLSLSLDLIKSLALDPAIKAWPGLGLAVQAYGKRSLGVIDWLDNLSHGRDKMHVRLVKGAYWDYEIKNAQVKGLKDYPVFTNKQLTDLNYLVTAKRLMECEKLKSSFATHNAHSIASIMSLSQSSKNEIEFQRLYGMGELLYSACHSTYERFPDTTIYCPVGHHKELLPYLVRRLLENGANSSFINKYLNTNIPAEDLAQNPGDMIKEKIDHLDLSNIELPRNLYLPRINSQGFDLNEQDCLQELMEEVDQFSKLSFQAYSKSTSGPIKNTPIEVISKCSSQAIGTMETCNLESINQLKINPSNKWLDYSVESRFEILNAVADLLEEQRPKFIYLLMHEAGKTLEDSIDEIREAVDFLRYYAHRATDLKPSSQRGPTGEDNILEYGPKGTVLCVSPWNFPLAITVGQIAAALAAGNTVISKPSEHTPIIAFEVIALFLDQGLPEDAIHLFLGEGDIAQAIISNQSIDLVAFTGSLKTAKKIHQSLSLKAGKIIPLIAETGGLNAMIVDSSALLERACDDIVRSAFNSAGQRCSALRLLLIHEEIYPQLISMLKGAMNDLTIGAPCDLNVDVGPIINIRSLNKLENYLDKMKSNGHNIFQASKESILQNGCLLSPTLIELELSSMSDEEQFGPILHVVSFSEDTLVDSLKEIDAKGFALTFGIHTRIDSRALDVAKHTSSGNIYINRDIVGAVVETQPFGGKNLSGSGFKAGGPNYLLQFMDERVVTVNTVAIGGNIDLINLDQDE
ncbi:bifunctional proline dehydrogenase/L-glutamate gamma-semialdehyde dehydrogenase PutA [Gammaproteobacteria bacterium]|nr:bifunctional proline dehydrogenase/L-glutamate gamma-semialdehyde dehydrogenase PutA [Gammaproteobacteria bacterium]